MGRILKGSDFGREEAVSDKDSICKYTEDEKMVHKTLFSLVTKNWSRQRVRTHFIQNV